MQPSDREIEAAARQLFREGKFRRWWPDAIATYDALDAPGREELDGIAERMLIAAAQARAPTSLT